MFQIYASNDFSSGKACSSNISRDGKQSNSSKYKNGKYCSENSRLISIPKTDKTHNKYAQSFK